MIPTDIINSWQQNPKTTVLNLVGMGLTEFPAELSDKLTQIYRLDISENSLKTLPEMPQLRYLVCRRNNIETLPCYPKLQYLDASYNNLTQLVDHPRLEELYVNFNKLQDIGRVPLLKVLFAVNNNLQCLPIMPIIETLIVDGNPIFGDSVCDWRVVWELRSLIEFQCLLRIIHRWQRITFSSKKRPIHDDLMTNPFLPNHSAFFTKLWNPLTQYVNHYQKIRDKYNIDTKITRYPTQPLRKSF